MNGLARESSWMSSIITNSEAWKFPSPTWPTMGAMIPPVAPKAPSAVGRLMTKASFLRDLLRERGPIARDGCLDDLLHVLLEKVALCRELPSRRAHLGTVVGLVPIALGKRPARIASLRARCLVRCEPEGEPIHWHDLLGRSGDGIAWVPAGVCADRHCDIGHADACRLVAIGVHGGDESRIDGALLRGIAANAGGLVATHIDGSDEG